MGKFYAAHTCEQTYEAEQDRREKYIKKTVFFRKRTKKGGFVRRNLSLSFLKVTFKKLCVIVKGHKVLVETD